MAAVVRRAVYLRARAGEYAWQGESRFQGFLNQVFGES